LISAHGLRHISTSLELERDTHPSVAMERLGHSSIETLLDIYSDVDSSLQERAADAMAAVLYVADEQVSGE
jgi:integrase